MFSGEKFPKVLSHAAMAAGGIAVGYLLREAKINRANERLEAARIQGMRAKAETREALELASQDSLTGLVNRRGFDEEYQKLCAAIRGNRQKDPGHGSLLILDLDRFKTINDTRGHATGDVVMRNTADTIAAQLREDDVVARIGGDEMAVLLPGATAMDAIKVAEKIRVAVKNNGEITLSAGVAEIDPDQPTQSIEYADAAAYRAKENGRDQVVELSPPLMSAAIH